MRVLIKLVYNKIIKKVTLAISHQVLEDERASRLLPNSTTSIPVISEFKKDTRKASDSEK